MVTDPIANFLTSLRNALKANKASVVVPYAKIKKEIAHVLQEQGYIASYEKKEEGIPHPLLYIVLKPRAMRSIKRISKPGLRVYEGVHQLTSVHNGLGIAILSTSKGVMMAKHAKKMNVGGEVLCHIY